MLLGRLTLFLLAMVGHASTRERIFLWKMLGRIEIVAQAANAAIVRSIRAALYVVPIPVVVVSK